MYFLLSTQQHNKEPQGYFFVCVSLLLFCVTTAMCFMGLLGLTLASPFRKSLWVTWVVPAARGCPLLPSGRVDKLTPPPAPVTPLRLPRPRVNGSTGTFPLIAPGQQPSQASVVTVNVVSFTYRYFCFVLIYCLSTDTFITTPQTSDIITLVLTRSCKKTFCCSLAGRHDNRFESPWFLW